MMRRHPDDWLLVPEPRAAGRKRRSALTDWRPGAPIGSGADRDSAIAYLRRQLIAEDADQPALTFWEAFGLLVGGAICVPLVVLGIFFICEVLL